MLAEHPLPEDHVDRIVEHRVLKSGRLLRDVLPKRRTAVAEHILRRYLDEAYLRQVLDAGLAARLREKRFGR